MPAYSRWEKLFKNKAVDFVSVHTPETEEEHVPANVDKALKKDKITHPVLLDNAKKNWNSWKPECWPTVYIVDKQGHVRNWWAGELDWESAGGERKMADKIKVLLTEQYEESNQ